MDILFYILKGSCCFSIFYFVYILFLKGNTFYTANRIYLLCIPVLGFVAPAWQSNLIKTNVTKILPDFYLDHLVRTPVDKQGFAPPFESSVFLAYLLISGIILLVKIYQILLMLNLYRMARYDEDLKLKVSNLSENGKAGSFYKLIFIGHVSAKVQADIIIEHERVHINQAHWADLIFSDLVIATNWFNPLAYLHRKSLVLQHEYLADELICSTRTDVKSYQHLLLAQAFNSPFLFPTHSFNNPSSLKLRIMKLHQKKSGKTQLFSYLVLAPSIVMATVFNSALSAKAPLSSSYKTSLAMQPMVPGSRNDSIPDIIFPHAQITGALYIVNGKKTTEKEAKMIPHDDIASINVYKSESAVKKYGPDGKDGVIEFILKK